MAANAPYYQLRQFTNGTNAPFATTDEDDYDLAASLAPHNAPLYIDSHPADSQSNTLEESHNLVELLEAATTAASEATGSVDISSIGAARNSMHNRNKRKRGASPSDDDTQGTAGRSNGQAASKRARTDIPTDPQLSNTEPSIPLNEAHVHDNREGSVHSATALFRRNSERTSRKYTRPPMSKLFISLQVTPENFLNLQAKAKAYMLDPEHPERQNCVGNRGKGDTDMVKLRLFNCVRDFLKDGVGEEFFGEHAEKPAELETMVAAKALGEDRIPEGRLSWPKDATKIISLVTPLLRRMVTNERQRMYAIETRKGGRKKDGMPEDAIQQQANTGSSHGDDIQPASHDRPLPDAAPPGLSMASQPVAASDHIHQALPTVSTSPVQSDAPNDILGVPQRQHELPSTEESIYDLRKINIQLVKNNAKLKVFRQVKPPEASAAEYSWDNLQTDIKYMLWQALKLYPALRPRERVPPVEGMGPEALRGLAVAATEFQRLSKNSEVEQTDAHHLQTENSAEPSPMTNISSTTLVQGDSKLHTGNLDPDLDGFVRQRDPNRMLSNVGHGGDAVNGLSPQPSDFMPSTSTKHSAQERNSSDSPQPITSLSETESIQNVLQTATDITSHSGPLSNDAAHEHPANSELLSSTAPNLQISPTSISADNSIHNYVIKVMLSEGLSEIQDASAWDKAKDQVAYSVWANGAMSVIIDLL